MWLITMFLSHIYYLPSFPIAQVSLSVSLVNTRQVDCLHRSHIKVGVTCGECYFIVRSFVLQFSARVEPHMGPGTSEMSHLSSE